MKILMLLECDYPPDIRVENETESLAEAGHEIHIASYTRKTSTDNNSLFREELENAVVFRKYISGIRYKSSVGALKLPFYFNFWRSYLKDLFAMEKYDAIHVHDLPLVKVGYEFSRKHKITLTADLHENWPALLAASGHTKTFMGRILSSNSRWRKYEKKYLNKVDNIVVVCREARERLERMRIEPDKIHIVSNTLNTKHFHLIQDNPDPRYITLFYGGTLAWFRGIHIVIKGLALLRGKYPEIRFWVLGAGKYLGQLKQLASALNVSEQVRFFGWVKLEKIYEHLQKCDFPVLPFIRIEHFETTIPHKLFQYMYSNKPVIVSDCTPLRSIIEETGSGVVYKNDSPEDFASKLQKFIEDKEFRKQFEGRGRSWVEKKYNWEVDAARLLQVYGRDR